MEYSAIFHDMDKRFSYAVDKDLFVIRVQVKKDDMKEVILHYEDKYIPMERKDTRKTVPMKKVAKWASIRYTDDHILDYMEVDASHAIFEVEVPEEWVGKTVGELDIRKRYNINILAVKNEGEFGIAISPDTYFEENHKLLVLGEYRALQKCFRI